MKSRAVIFALAACALALPTGLSAQEPAPLTLEEAIERAKQTSPTYLQSLNDLAPANWNVKNANARLFLPSASVGLSGAWQDAGEQRLGGATFPQPAVLLSQYQVSLNYGINGTRLFQPGQRKAERRAVERQIDNAELTLRQGVTSAYLEVLRLEAQADQAEREMVRAEEALRLAEARREVGAGTRLEVMQADVARGRAEIAVLTQQNSARVAKLRLIEALGVRIPPERIELTSEFEVFQPDYEIDDLITEALARHPNVLSARAQRDAANSQIKIAKAAYFPSLSLQASWSGFTREETEPELSIAQDVAQEQQSAAAQTQACQEAQELYNAVGLTPPVQDCSQFAFTSADSMALASQFREINDQFPFAFQNEPVTLSAFISIPIFNNFDTQAQVEQAVAARNDIDHVLRATELRIRADVAEAVYNLETAYQTVILQRENTERAREELRLARERYQLGAGTFLELLDSEALTAQAEVDEIDAIFAFHQNLAALEAAIGRPISHTGDNGEN